ncbi:MAG: hypothetical protein GX251_05600 [Firmicutes bacterium]|nr:hypothetical protein [Bacillota bacterium]
MPKGWKRKLTAILFAIGLLGVGFVVGQYYLHRLYQRQVEVSYRRALGEFGTHLGEIAAELGRARLAVSSKQKGLIAANLRRLIYAAQINMGELPLGEIQLERMSHLLDHVYEQTHVYFQGDMDTNALHSLYQQIDYVSHELGNLLIHKEQEFPWVSWHEYFSTTALVPGFMQALTAINDGLEEYRSTIRQGEIQGEMIGRQQAMEIARSFSGRADLSFQVTNETKGGIPAYTVEAIDDRARHVLEISQRGGRVLWMTVTPLRAAQEDDAKPILSLEEIVERGAEFLEQRGLGALHITDVQVLQNRATLTFVPTRDGILRYGEPLRVQVNTTDGSIIGFWATSFFAAQSRVHSEMAAAGEVAWKMEDRVQEGVEILDQKLALIQNERQEEVLTTRLGVKYGEDYYLIYLNLETGDEEQIVQVSSPQFF